jgi:hypothetical protein
MAFVRSDKGNCYSLNYRLTFLSFNDIFKVNALIHHYRLSSSPHTPSNSKVPHRRCAHKHWLNWKTSENNLSVICNCCLNNNNAVMWSEFHSLTQTTCTHCVVKMIALPFIKSIIHINVKIITQFHLSRIQFGRIIILLL